MEPVFPNYFQVEDELGALFLVLMTREEYYSDPKIRKKIFDFHQQAKHRPYSPFRSKSRSFSLSGRAGAASRKSNLRGRKLFIQQSFFRLSFS